MNDSIPPKHRWYCLTPDRLLLVVMPIVGLLMCKWFGWLPFDEYRGWAMSIAVIVLATLALLLWLGVGLASRRRFQFSIRSLLLFVVVVAAACGWLMVEVRKAERRAEAVAAIREAGGQVTYDYDPPENKPPPPAWLRNLFGDDLFCDVVSVWLPEEAGDAQLEHVTKLTRLKYLTVQGHITDAGFEHLKEMPHLYWVAIRDPKITYERLDKLQEAMPDTCVSHPLTAPTR